MQRLILLRHGKTEAVSASGADIDRGLTDRGRRDCDVMARRLADAGLSPTLALVSSARRARETWGLLAPSFPGARLDLDPSLYLASAERIAELAELAAASEPDGRLIVVGHNPGLHELAWSLAARDHGPVKERLEAGFPTAAAAVFGRPANGRWSLERLMTPRDAEEGRD